MSTVKAKMAIDKMVDRGGKKVKPMSAAMIEVGYSPAYAKNPKKFLNTKTAKELLAEYLPDELIAQRHSELLNSGKIEHYLFPKSDTNIVRKGKKVKAVKVGLTNEEIRMIVESVPGCRLIYVKRDFMGAWAYFEAPDYKARKEAIDMAYKRKGEYAPDKIELTKRKYQHLSDEELMAHKKALIDFLKKR